MNNRQLAAAKTRQRLVETAKRIICEKGLAGTSVEELTEACGVSKGTFYTYFKRKEDIVYELSGAVFDEILEKARSSKGSLLERLEGYMISFARYIEMSSLKLAQEWIRNTADPDISDAGAKKLDKDIAAAEALLREGIGSGELTPDAPVTELAVMINEMLYGQMLCWALRGVNTGFEERTRMFCKTYLRDLIGIYIINK